MCCLILLGIYSVIRVGFSAPNDTQALGTEAASVSAQHIVKQEYAVCLKPNTFFDTPCQPKGRQYLASLTDAVKLGFGYKLRADAALDYAYSYEIAGKLVVYDKDDKARELLAKEYTLQPRKTGSNQQARAIDIADTYALNYQEFNEYARTFKEQNGLGGEAMLLVSMKIDLTVLRGDQKITRPVVLTYTVPLTKQTYNVQVGEPPKEDEILQFVVSQTTPFHTYLILLIALVGGGLVLGISLFIHYRRTHRLSAAERYDRRIHKEYGRIIVDLMAPLHAHDYTHHYGVKDFVSLVGKADRVMQNILCYTAPDGRTIYAVIEGDSIYIHSQQAKKKPAPRTPAKRGSRHA